MGPKQKESSSSQDSKLWTWALAAPNKWVQVINRDGRWWESGQVNKETYCEINHEHHDNSNFSSAGCINFVDSTIDTRDKHL